MEVKIVSEIWVRPSSPTPTHLRHYRLSLLDQIIPVPIIPFIFFYKHDELISLNQQLELLKNKLSQTLSDFYVLAGKIMEDDLTVDCKDDGVHYVEALVDCEMTEFLSRPDLLQMNKLVPSGDMLKGTHVANIQINVFKCGSLAIGLCISHKIVDGAGVGIFMNAWAAAARRSVGYSNPKPNFNSSSVFPAENPWLREVAATAAPSLNPGNFITKRLVFTSPCIEKLREEAAAGGCQRPTRVQVVSALLWKSHMRAFCKRQELKNEEKGITSWSSKSVLNHAVNMRPRTRAELPITDRTVGNMVWFATAVTQHSLAPDLGFLSGKISEAIAKIDTDFIDRLSGEEAEVKPPVLESLKDSITSVSSRIGFTSWCKLGFYDVDFGWGKPIWIGGLAVKAAAFFNMVVLIETRDGIGIEAWVTTDEPELEVMVSDPDIVRFALVDPSPLHEFS